MHAIAVRLSTIAVLLAPVVAGCAASQRVSAPVPASSAPARALSGSYAVPPPPPETVAAQPSSTAAPKAGLSLAGVDPCTLLSATATLSLGISSKGAKSRNEVLDNAQMCSYPPDSRHLGLLITAVPTKGLEFFGPGRVAGAITRTTVAGLPAYRNAPADAPPGSNFCTVTVGVRDGQALDVLFREAETEQSVGQKVLCGKANTAAGAAVAALARH